MCISRAQNDWYEETVYADAVSRQKDGEELHFYRGEELAFCAPWHVVLYYGVVGYDSEPEETVSDSVVTVTSVPELAASP